MGIATKRAVTGALLASALFACSEAAPTMTVRRVQHDLLADASSWEVLEHPDGRPPEVAVITPSIDPLVDAADRLSLVMPPPARVRFRVPPGDAALALRCAAGVDLTVARGLPKDGPPLSIDFEIRVDGERAWHESIATHPKLAREMMSKQHVQHRWQEVGGASGLTLEPGSVVELRTSFSPGSQPPAGLEAVRAGFAELVLEHRIERPRTKASADHPNLILVVMDTLRADRTSLLGYERPTTPNLDQLAARGLTFESAYATSSWTWPSTASILTGLLPEAHGVLSYRSCLLAEELETLGEVLQESGYTTAAFSGNPLISPWRNFDQGFESFDATGGLRMSDAVVPDALRWLERNAEHRFFLYLHLIDPHTPHTPRRQDMQRFCGVTDSNEDPQLMDTLGALLRQQKEHTKDGQPRPELLVSDRQARWCSDVYDASVATGDYWLGQVLRTLDSLGLTDETLVAFTSDHGEELLDHGLLEHSHSLFEELVRVPLVLAGPGAPAGARVRTPVSNRHLGPTLARLCGASLTSARDALPLESADELPERPIFIDTRKGWWNGREFLPLHGVRAGDWVLHWSPRGKDWDATEGAAPGAGQMRLFDLAQDPGQQRDVSAGEHERAEALRALVERQLAASAELRPGRRVAAGAATLEMLRGIGYAEGEDEDEE